MILDIENDNRKKTLKISYFDKEGKVALNTYDTTQFKSFNLCSPNDKEKEKVWKNWDDKPVKKTYKEKLSKFDILDFIYDLPQEEYEKITSFNLPSIQSIDIETEVSDGFPEPSQAKERIQTIAISFENNKCLVLSFKPLSVAEQKQVYDEFAEYLKDFGTWEFKYIQFDNEYDLLNSFIHKILPACSLVIGWNVLRFDWQYIYNRCLRLGINPSNASPTGALSKDNVPLHIGFIDYLDIYKKYDRSVAIKENNKLEEVANVVLGISKLSHGDSTFKDFYESNWPRFVLYNAIDTALVILIHRKLKTINAFFSVSTQFNISIYKAFSAVNLTEALLWKGYRKQNKCVANPRLNVTKGEYEGAYVKDPIPGIFIGACCFDFASLYPSIMNQFNTSPESFVRKINCEEDKLKFENNPDYILAVNGSVYTTKNSIVRDEVGTLYKDRRRYKDCQLEIEQRFAKLKLK